MGFKGIIALSLLILIFSSGCLGQQTQTTAPSGEQAMAEKPDFNVVSPSADATITGDSVTVTVEPINVAIKPAGGPVKESEGHFHFTLDTGGYSPTAETSKVYTGLSPGQHTVTVELMNNDHSSRSPKILKTVTFTVASTTGGAQATTAPTPTSKPASPYLY